MKQDLRRMVFSTSVQYKIQMKGGGEERERTENEREK